MIFNEIKCHVNTSFGLVGGMHPLHPPLCPRLVETHREEVARSEVRYLRSLLGIHKMPL